MEIDHNVGVIKFGIANRFEDAAVPVPCSNCEIMEH